MKKGIKSTPAFKIATVIICALIIILSLTTTPPEGLEVVGWRTLAVLLVTIILFITEALPSISICFLIIVFLKYLGINSLSNIVKSAASTTIFFSMCGMGIGAALKNTNLAAVLLKQIFKVAKGDSRKMIMAATWLTAIISIFVSDGAAQIVVIAVVTSIIASIGDPEPGTSRLAGGMMMGITVGSFTGGLCMPCSNTANVAIMELAETVGGKEMTFLQWSLFGIPVGLLTTFFAALAIANYFKPDKLNEIEVANINKVIDSIPDKLTLKDTYYLIITICMVVLWIASNWVKILDTTTVAIIGLALMMIPIPKLQLLTVKQYKANFGSSVIVTMMCMFPLAAAMKTSGLGEWVVSYIFADAAKWSILVLFLVASVCGFILHLLIPSGNACGVLSVTMMAPIMVGAGIPVSAAIACIGFQTGATYLFPIEGTWQYTFGYGHYKFDDCVRANWWLQIVAILLGAIIPWLICLAFGSAL